MTPFDTMKGQMDFLFDAPKRNMISNRERAIEADYDNEREPQENDGEMEARALLAQHGD